MESMNLPSKTENGEPLSGQDKNALTTTSNKFVPGDRALITMANSGCRITAEVLTVDKFGATEHYGVSMKIDRAGAPSTYQYGWIPTVILDESGYKLEP